jgi:microcystin-dependent protein
MSEPFLGMIATFGFTFAPRGWAFCNGQLLSIAQNTALFSLLGTTYGGDGQTTFALPNLQSRLPLHFGTGPGLSAYDLGEVTGTENVTLTQNQLASHLHAYTIPATSLDGTTPVPAANATLANSGGDAIYSTAAANVQMAGGNTTLTGGNQPFSDIQPLLALNFCISLEGIFPSRN